MTANQLALVGASTRAPLNLCLFPLFLTLPAPQLQSHAESSDSLSLLASRFDTLLHRIDQIEAKLDAATNGRSTPSPSPPSRLAGAAPAGSAPAGTAAAGNTADTAGAAPSPSPPLPPVPASASGSGGGSGSGNGSASALTNQMTAVAGASVGQKSHSNGNGSGEPHPPVRSNSRHMNHSVVSHSVLFPHHTQNHTHTLNQHQDSASNGNTHIPSTFIQQQHHHQQQQQASSTSSSAALQPQLSVSLAMAREVAESSRNQRRMAEQVRG